MAEQRTLLGPGSVRARLLRLTLLLLLPGLGISVYVIWRSFEADRSVAELALRETARTLDQLVDREFVGAEVLLRTLAATDALASGLAGNDLSAFARLARKTAVMGGHVVLLDAEWRTRLDSGAEPGGDAGADAAAPSGSTPLSLAAPAAVHAGGIVILPARRDRGGLMVPVLLPLPSGALGLLIPASSFQTLITGQRLPPGWLVSIMDSGLTLVARSHEAARYIGRAAGADMRAGLAAGDEGIRAGRSIEGTLVVFAYSRSMASRWTVGVASPVDAVAQNAVHSLEVLAALGSLAVVLGLLGALLVARGIARPIEAVARAARTLGEGGWMAPLAATPFRGLRETDQVSAALQTASRALAERAHALSELNRTLAARVEERTRALAQANAQLDSERLRLRSILDHMPVGVLVRSPGQAVFYANSVATALLGQACELPPSAPARGEPAAGEVPQALARAAAGQKLDREPLSLTLADGSKREVEISAGPILDPAGDVVLSVTTLQDVTARLEAEEARRRSQRLEAVGQLTGGVAHEFNNLLMAISGALDLAAPHVPTGRGLSMLEHARRATDRGARLTRQLLAFARKQHLQVEAIDLNALVSGLTELLESTLGRSVQVATVLDPHAWPALADAAQLELVLLNLAINARDAMEGGGRITIATANMHMGEPVRPEDPPAGDHAVLALADTGSGMASAVLARAFEPFFTTKDVGRGSGLGLAQVLGVAQQLGGGVAIESAPGRGTLVRVFLPRADHSPQAARAISPAASPQTLPGLRVLLVDDDAEVRDVARVMLEEMGAVVSEAADGAAALLLLRTGPGIDAVLADLSMPAMSGLDLAREIARLAPGLPVVLMTGYSTEALDAGGVLAGTLQKPFRGAELAAALRRAGGLRP